MVTRYYDDYIDLAEEICDRFERLKQIKDDDIFKDVCIIGKYEEIKNIIQELVVIGFEIHSIELRDVEWEEYDDEYICSVCAINNEDGEIWCEPMKRDGKYLSDESPVAYVFDNCSSAVLKKLDAKEIYEVSVGEEYDTETENADNESVKASDKEVSTAKEIYKVDGKAVSKEEFEAALEKFNSIENKYLDNIKGMLLNYCEVLDELNEWRKLLSW